MAFPIEILVTNKSLLPDIKSAIQSLNTVQNEFYFALANEHLLAKSYTFTKENYTNKEINEWLTQYRTSSGGNRPYVMLVIDKHLSGKTLSNLFGGHTPGSGLAWFTTDSFSPAHYQFVFDRIRFCRYYFVRYILSYVAPDIKGHATKGCMFDKKIDKTHLLLSLKTGNICDECWTAIRQSAKYSVDVDVSIKKMLGVVSNQYPRALVMKGGGVKGLALVGALRELEKYFTFDTFAGTSAGAIAATLLAAGYTPTELQQILIDKDFKQFKSKRLNKVINLFAKSGLHSGKPFLDWIDGLLKTKISSQISEIKMRDLPNRAVVYATTVGEGLLRFDSNGERKDTSAAFATRCSMSIPGFFVAEKIENKKIYDGGLGYNFPLRTFIADNANSLFIGLYLTSDIKRNGGLFSDLSDIVTDSDERQIVDQHLDKIVIIDPRPIKTTQFKLSQSDKDYLLQAGKVGALKYLAAHHKDLQIVKSEVEAAERDLIEKRKHLSVPGYSME